MGAAEHVCACVYPNSTEMFFFGNWANAHDVNEQ